MAEAKAKPATVDEYIAQFPDEVQSRLKKIRELILETAPGATEKISYQVPGYFLNGSLVWFGAAKRHIGFYPKGSGIEAFDAELPAYKRSKGAVQFPHDRPVPYDLIRKIVKFRVAENMMKDQPSKKGRSDSNPP